MNIMAHTLTDFTAIASAILVTDWSVVKQKLDDTEQFVVQQVLKDGALSHNPSTTKAALSALRKAHHNG